MGMDKPSLNIVRAADIAAHAQEFSHPWNPQSLMHGTQLARSVGLKRTGVNFMRVPPGRESYVYHSHRYEEEWMYVLSGSRQSRSSMGRNIPIAALATSSGFPHAVGGAPVAQHRHERPRLSRPAARIASSRLRNSLTLGKRMVRMGQQVDIYDVDDAKAFGPL